MPKLTVKAIAAIRAPDPSGKQKLHWDAEMKGFAVLASGTTNSKAFVVQRTLGPRGKSRRVTIGSVATMTLEEARDQAAAMIEQLRLGIDPKTKTVDHTVKEALDDYLAGRKDLRPESVRAYKQIERWLASWMSTKLREIDGDAIEKRHRELAAEIGEFTANAAMRTFRIIYNWAADRVPDLPPNPVRRLKRQWYAEPRRTGIVRSDEMPRFYAAVQALENPIARDYILTLLFTGMRKTETATLRWTDIDFGERVIRIQAAAAKSVKKLDLPMCNEVRNILIARRSLGETDFVFPGSGETGRLWDPGLAAVQKATGIKVTPHWLRRGWLTIAESLDISPIALKVLVNHSVGKDVTSGYVMLTNERLRDAAQKVADRIKALCEVPVVAEGNIASLSG